MIETTVCPEGVQGRTGKERTRKIRGDGECGERDGGQFLTQHWESVGGCMRQHGYAATRTRQSPTSKGETMAATEECRRKVGAREERSEREKEKRRGDAHLLPLLVCEVLPVEKRWHLVPRLLNRPKRQDAPGDADEPAVEHLPPHASVHVGGTGEERDDHGREGQSEAPCHERRHG